MPELQELALDGREVRLCFDSDYEKPQVAAALQSLAQWLAEQGAQVLVEVLPNGLDGERLGLDDLIHRHGAAVFLEIAAIARCPFKTVRRSGEDVLVWTFNPEPLDTRERNVYLHGLHGRNWRRSDDGGDHWQHWCGTDWEPLASSEQLAATVEQFAALQGWKNRELQTVRSLMAAFRRTIEPPADGAAAAGLVPFLNGCLRLSDQQLIAHNRDHGNTWSLPYSYDREASCRGVQQWLSDALGDEASVGLLRAFARALLTGDRLKCFLEIVGLPNSGKSVLTNLLVALVGHGNTATSALHRIEDPSQRFETIRLRGKRLVLFPESQGYRGALEAVKRLTGDDTIAAEIKGGQAVAFYFHGGVVITGNSPIRSSDPSGAVMNRRRSLWLERVIASRDERQLLETDGSGGWRGEFVCELPGFVNWVLAMPASDARAALARDVQSLARADAELQTQLASDPLVEWADEFLEWCENPAIRVRVGTADDDADEFAYPHYRRWLAQTGAITRPLASRDFKARIVELLRDTLGLPMPSGHPKGGAYRVRNLGSVLPCLRLRSTGENNSADEPPIGAVTAGFRARVAERVEPEPERMRNGETPVGNGWNGWNGSDDLQVIRDSDGPLISHIGEWALESVPSVPSSPSKGSAVPQPFPSRSDPFQIDVLNAKTGQWEPGWRQITTGSGSGSVLCSSPKGYSRQVERKLIRPSQALR